MDAVFLKILNMSITAGWLVLAVIPLRLVLKKAPKALLVGLWALVGLRLILHVSFESDFSLLPSKEFIPEETVYSHSTADPKGGELLDFIEHNPVSYELTVKDGSLTFSEFTAPDEPPADLHLRWRRRLACRHRRNASLYPDQLSAHSPKSTGGGADRKGDLPL